MDFVKWCHDMQFKWLAVDCGSADHPMNTKIRDWEPREAELCDKLFKERYGKGLNEIYEWPKTYQAMHLLQFPKKYGEIIHVECVGGQIGELSNKRCVIGCFPWRFKDGESAFCRVVAFAGFDV
jgi:kynurenine formamidase